MTDLAQLIRDRAQGESNRQIAERAGVSPETVNRIMKGVGGQSLETIDKIAIALNIPLATAREAAARPTPGSPFRDELPEGVDQLSARRRRIAVDVIRELIEAEEAEYRFESLRELLRLPGMTVLMGEDVHSFIIRDLDRIERQLNRRRRPAEEADAVAAEEMLETAQLIDKRARQQTGSSAETSRELAERLRLRAAELSALPDGSDSDVFETPKFEDE